MCYQGAGKKKKKKKKYVYGYKTKHFKPKPAEAYKQYLKIENVQCMDMQYATICIKLFCVLGGLGPIQN